MLGISREEAEIYSVQCVTIDEYLQGVNVILFFFILALKRLIDLHASLLRAQTKSGNDLTETAIIVLFVSGVA